LIELGQAALALAFLTAIYAVVAALLGRNGDRRWVDSSRRAVYALCALLTLCVVVLELAFARNDFSFALVAGHSSTTTPFAYKLAAMWSSQEGSLLLWAWVLSIASSAVLFATRNRMREIVPWATAVLMVVGAFFVGLALFAATPFTHLANPPADGQGLEPLLRHPSMMIHPPMLYSGYVFWTIPFAFAIGALITRRVDASWIRTTRRFALIAWTFLGIGLLLGSRWSYTELGWGGFWAWDPVENAALMPWLAGTAFLHSIMVQEKRGMLKVWNVSLIVGTFALALFGTFLVRSGVLQSIHAFGDSTVGPYILSLIAVVVLGSALLIASRHDDLRSEKRIDSLLSREAVFLVNNLLLVGLVVVIFWGTVFPLVSELFTGNKSSLAAPWFDRYTTPLAVVLVLFTGIGPLVAWRRVSWASAKRVFLWPGLCAAAVAALLLAATDAGSRPWAMLLFVFASFSLAALAQEFWRGAAARRSLTGDSPPAALLGVAARNRRRYGGYIVHAGVAVLLIGIAASSSFQTNRDITLGPGQSSSVDGYAIKYVRPTVNIDNERIAYGAVLDVKRDGKQFATLTPTRNYYRPVGASGTAIRAFVSGGESTSEVGLKAGARNDFWTAMQPNLSKVNRSAAAAQKGFVRCLRSPASAPPACQSLAALMRGAAQNPRLRPAALAQVSQVQGQIIRNVAQSYLHDPPPATFKVIVNPLVTWMWIGGLIALIGALIAIWPTPGARRRRVSSLYGARLGQELSKA
jgi:cytochrome c-type biogenesis protein CcmF